MGDSDSLKTPRSGHFFDFLPVLALDASQALDRHAVMNPYKMLPKSLSVNVYMESVNCAKTLA